MTHHRAAKRYAKAFISFISENNSEEKTINEIKNLQEILFNNRDLRSFLKSPIIENKKKISIAEEVFKPYSDETKRLISLIIKNGRSEILVQVVNEIININRKQRGIQKAVITSAKALTDAQNKAIKNHLLNIMKANDIEIENKVDASLLGGFKIRIEDLLYDATIQTKLNRLKQELSIK